MKLEDFQEKFGDIDDDINNLVVNGQFKAGHGNEYVPKYEKLLRDGLDSNNAEDIINRIAFYLYAGALCESALNQLNEQVNEIVVPAFNNQNVAYENLILAVSSLQNKINLSKESRVKAGKARAKNDPRSQVLDQIEAEYRKREENGYNFNLSGHLTKFYEEMHGQYSDIVKYESIKRRIEKVRKDS